MMSCFASKNGRKLRTYFLLFLEAFNALYNILPNLDEKDTFFLYREQNHPMLEGYSHPFLKGYYLA